MWSVRASRVHQICAPPCWYCGGLSSGRCPVTADTVNSGHYHHYHSVTERIHFHALYHPLFFHFLKLAKPHSTLWNRQRFLLLG